LSSTTSTGPLIEVSLNSVFASRKQSFATDEKISPTSAMIPSTFQVSAKIDEESRKDNHLIASFLFTLNDSKGMITYEFRGSCSIIGSSADFESVMEAHKDARVPKILDIIYQRLYPVVFILAGMTGSTYPQSVALISEMISSGVLPTNFASQIKEPENGKALPRPEAVIVQEKTVVLEQHGPKIDQIQQPTVTQSANTNGDNPSKPTPKPKSSTKMRSATKATAIEHTIAQPAEETKSAGMTIEKPKEELQD